MTRRARKRAAAERTRAELFDPVTGLVPWVTPRQLEYWVERGWIISAGPPSQGRPRVFSATEKRVLAVLARLVRAGFGAQQAAGLARTAVTISEQAGDRPGDTVYVPLGEDGLLLVVRDV